MYPFSSFLDFWALLSDRTGTFVPSSCGPLSPHHFLCLADVLSAAALSGLGYEWGRLSVQHGGWESKQKNFSKLLSIGKTHIQHILFKGTSVMWKQAKLLYTVVLSVFTWDLRDLTPIANIKISRLLLWDEFICWYSWILNTRKGKSKILSRAEQLIYCLPWGWRKIFCRLVQMKDGKTRAWTPWIKFKWLCTSPYRQGSTDISVYEITHTHTKSPQKRDSGCVWKITSKIRWRW